MSEGLCVYWRFDEVQDGKVLDASGMNNRGTLALRSHVSARPLPANDPISDEDEWGEKVRPGHSLIGPLSCAALNGLSSITSYTCEFFAKRVGVPPTGDSHEFFIFANAIKVLLNMNGTVSLVVDSTTFETTKRVPLNQWIHFALVVSDSTLSLLVDGVPAFSNVQTSPLENPVSIELGSNWFECTEFRIWSLARTAVAIRESMRSPLPRSAPVSKWKGLRINTSAPSEGKTGDWEKPVVFDNVLRRLSKSRRVHPTEEETDSLRTHSMLFEAPEAPQPIAENAPAAPVVPDEAISAEQSVSDFPNGSVSGFSANTPALSPILQLRPVARPIVPCPSDLSLSAAVAIMDENLNNTIGTDDLSSEFQSVEAIVHQIANYMRTKFRTGPFLYPMPPEALLVRLRIACNYMGLVNVTNAAQCSALVALRIPLLAQHVYALTIRAADDAGREGDIKTERVLLRTLLGTFKARMEASKIDKFRGRLDQLIQDDSMCTLQKCPLCTAPFDDPMQVKCGRGCGSQLSVCYLTGKLVASADCVRCIICESTMSISQQAATRQRSAPTSRTVGIPTVCVVCSCSGCLRALD